jgi:glycine cleavage system H protein
MAYDVNDQFELTLDKFTFGFPKELRYSEAGLWIRQEGNLFRLGLSDFAQQRNGDIAFANLMPPGTELAAGDEIASIETVKVNISLPSPVKGTILEINPAIQEAPELINQEPYGLGWMAVVQAEAPEQQVGGLLNAGAYVALAREQAEAELKS